MARRFSPGRRKLLQATALLPSALAGGDSKRNFTAAEFELVQELTETIIPADPHSAGAKAAGVADFIQQTLQQTVDASQRNLWSEGLRLVDASSKKRFGKPFVAASVEERNQVLASVSNTRFFQELKRLTVLGYYTSKIGILDELEYKGNRIHNEFSGCDAD